jgi:Na+-translocating ferredoxin:NAD+ oxidoreductase RnfD subunit
MKQLHQKNRRIRYRLVYLLLASLMLLLLALGILMTLPFTLVLLPGAFSVVIGWTLFGPVLGRRKQRGVEVGSRRRVRRCLVVMRKFAV